jgi:GMP synthase PP-ATPase subunit
MKIVNASLLRIARAFGLVRGVRLVRVRDDRRRMCWAIALRVLGGWYVLGRDSMTSPWVIQRDPWRNPRPLLFPNLPAARRLLAGLRL